MTLFEMAKGDIAKCKDYLCWLGRSIHVCEQGYRSVQVTQALGQACIQELYISIRQWPDGWCSVCEIKIPVDLDESCGSLDALIEMVFQRAKTAKRRWLHGGHGRTEMTNAQREAFFIYRE